MKMILSHPNKPMVATAAKKSKSTMPVTYPWAKTVADVMKKAYKKLDVEAMIELGGDDVKAADKKKIEVALEAAGYKQAHKSADSVSYVRTKGDKHGVVFNEDDDGYWIVELFNENNYKGADPAPLTEARKKAGIPEDATTYEWAKKLVAIMKAAVPSLDTASILDGSEGAEVNEADATEIYSAFKNKMHQVSTKGGSFTITKKPGAKHGVYMHKTTDDDGELAYHIELFNDDDYTGTASADQKGVKYRTFEAVAKGPTPAAVEKAKKILQDADKASQKESLETFADDASELRSMRNLAAQARKAVEAAKTGPAFKEYDKARAELMRQVAELDAQHLESVEAVEKTYKEGLLAAATKAKEVAVQQAALIDAGLVPKLNKSQLGALGWGYSLARINFNAADLTAKPTVAATKKA